ncbi:hypothetical protein [Cribrihabitans pelagius]|uniref:hypothetical protein n=1 Tax=Cribrihabitans pelagius TaxID=1765746 RepID=UPI003B5C5D09
MPTHLFPASSRHARPQLSPLKGVTLAQGRAHEACGPARHRFALWLAAAVQGPVLWIAPAWNSTRLNPDGMSECTTPGRFLFVQATRAEDLLWSMEEALRSGAAPLVVAELPEPPAMTPVRRLHLAAESASENAGAAGRAQSLPLGLLLTPGGGGARGIESRWHLAPAHPAAAPQAADAPNSAPCEAHAGVPRTLDAPAAAPAPAPGWAPGWAQPRQWQLHCLRARTSPPRRWQIRQAAPGAPLQATPVPALAETQPPAAAAQAPHSSSPAQPDPALPRPRPAPALPGQS